MQQTAVRVLEAAFIAYPVADVSRARKFYESVLHLVPAMHFEDNGQAWIEYDLKGTALAITNMGSERGWKPSSSGPSLGLEVDDFEQTVQSLKAEKVQFYVEPFDTPVCHMCVIADPDGNTLIIHKRK